MTTTKPFRDLIAEIETDPHRKALLDEERRAVKAILALSRARGRRGLTQAQVAAAMRVSRKRVSTIECEGNPTLGTLRAYADAIGGKPRVSIDFDDGTVVPIAAE